jgi:hypothetical protein
MGIKLTPGLKANNPGNLRWGRAWPGLVGYWTDDDGRKFCKFRTMAEGLRALLDNAATYPQRYGVKTLQEFGNVWAPASDNKGDSQYGTRLATWCGVKPDAAYDFRGTLSLYTLARAIIRNENGVAMLALIEPQEIRAAAEVVSATGGTFPPKVTAFA